MRRPISPKTGRSRCHRRRRSCACARRSPRRPRASRCGRTASGPRNGCREGRKGRPEEDGRDEEFPRRVPSPHPSSRTSDSPATRRTGRARGERTRPSPSLFPSRNLSLRTSHPGGRSGCERSRRRRSAEAPRAAARAARSASARSRGTGSRGPKGTGSVRIVMPPVRRRNEAWPSHVRPPGPRFGAAPSPRGGTTWPGGNRRRMPVAQAAEEERREFRERRGPGRGFPLGSEPHAREDSGGALA